MTTLMASDYLTYNVELKIVNNKLIAVWDGEESEIELKDIILIEERIK